MKWLLMWALVIVGPSLLLFVIGLLIAPPAGVIMSLPGEAAAVRAQAPKVRLTLVPSGTLNLADRLDRGELDLAISARALEGSALHRTC